MPVTALLENTEISPADIKVMQILDAKDNWSFELTTSEHLNKVTERIIYLSENKFNNSRA